MNEKSKKLCNMNCCVYGCHSKKGRSREISFHLFPKANLNKVYITNKFNTELIDRRKAWVLILKMGKPVTDSMRVCSLHFKKEDFIAGDRQRKYPRLKKTAVPSKNLPVGSFPKTFKKISSREERLQKRKAKVCKFHETLPNTSAFLDSSCIRNDIVKNLEENPVEVRAAVSFNSLNFKEKEAVRGLMKLCDKDENQDKGVQVKSGDLLIPFISVIDSDAKLNSLTGLCSFNLLDSILILVNKYFPPLKSSILTMREKVILTFMKLKIGVTYVVLACLFRVTGKTCRNIVCNMIAKLAVVLGPAIYWPDMENTRKNRAKCFDSFNDTRVILDCTEIPIQKPKCLCCRVMTYSSYYGTHTVKYMTGISPSGLIIFVSKGYGGRASDKIIFKQSNLIDRLEKGRDAIIVDKGYLIEDLTSENFIKLIRPPFLRKKSQLSREEALSNVKIAKARVHVERANQRIKIFEIFKKKLPWSLVKKIDEIFIVICAIVNLSAPILADDKF